MIFYGPFIWGLLNEEIPEQKQRGLLCFCCNTLIHYTTLNYLLNQDVCLQGQSPHHDLNWGQTKTLLLHFWQNLWAVLPWSWSMGLKSLHPGHEQWSAPGPQYPHFEQQGLALVPSHSPGEPSSAGNSEPQRRSPLTFPLETDFTVNENIKFKHSNCGRKSKTSWL